MSLFCVELVFYRWSVFFMRDKTNGYIYYDYHKKTEKEEISDTAWTSVFHWLSALIAVLFVFFTVWIFFFQVVEVDGSSMSPTLTDGDRLVVSTFDYMPKTGDIVVIGAVDSENVCLVKRIIATENQTVDVDYDKGQVIVDGVVIDEPYLSEKMSEHIKNEIEYPYTVPEGCIFVMGDNRRISKDSRDKEHKSISVNYIVGKALCKLTFSTDADIYK